jgi:hypothetical protein
LEKDIQKGTNAEIFDRSPDRTFVPSLSMKQFEPSDGKSLTMKNVKFRMGSVPILFSTTANIKLSSPPFSLGQKYRIN